MPPETDRWTELTDQQASFFADQLDAMGKVAFSKVAHDAGIMPMRANTYHFGLNQIEHNVVIWQDPYEHVTACALTACRYGTEPASFMRLTRNAGSYAIEGVSVRMPGRYGDPVNLYGQQLVLLNPNEVEDVAQITVNFLDAGIQQASTSALNEFTTETGIRDSRLVGVTGNTVGRIFRSLNSLSSSLMINGEVNEGGVFSDQLYDLAQALLKVAITGINRSSGPTASKVLLDDNNDRPNGAVFESAASGITVVRRIRDYPNTIALATAYRPGVDDQNVFIEQHSIQSIGARLDVMTIPAEAYNPQAVVDALKSIMTNPKQVDYNVQAVLDEHSRRILEQNITRLLNERLNQIA